MAIPHDTLLSTRYHPKMNNALLIRMQPILTLILTNVDSSLHCIYCTEGSRIGEATLMRVATPELGYSFLPSDALHLPSDVFRSIKEALEKSPFRFNHFLHSRIPYCPSRLPPVPRINFLFRDMGAKVLQRMIIEHECQSDLLLFGRSAFPLLLLNAATSLNPHIDSITLSMISEEKGPGHRLGVLSLLHGSSQSVAYKLKLHFTGPCLAVLQQWIGRVWPPPPHYTTQHHTHTFNQHSDSEDCPLQIVVADVGKDVECLLMAFAGNRTVKKLKLKGNVIPDDVRHNDPWDVMDKALGSLQHIPHITIRFPDAEYLSSQRLLTERPNVHIKASKKDK